MQKYITLNDILFNNDINKVRALLYSIIFHFKLFFFIHCLFYNLIRYIFKTLLLFKATIKLNVKELMTSSVLIANILRLITAEVTY